MSPYHHHLYFKDATHRLRECAVSGEKSAVTRIIVPCRWLFSGDKIFFLDYYFFLYLWFSDFHFDISTWLFVVVVGLVLVLFGVL